MNYRYMGVSTEEEIANCQTDTFTDYDGKQITLSGKAKEMFTEIVDGIKTVLNCNTNIVNGDLEILDSMNSLLGTNINRGELIVIDNFYIDEAYKFTCFRRELVKTICHEIAHNKYDYHGRWHSRLTEQYFEAVKSVVLLC